MGHVAFADPFAQDQGDLLYDAMEGLDITRHQGGTIVCMEGPLFSTRAESNFYRKAVDASVIGMTALPEAKLAREAELCYAMLAMGTDYDCWHEEEEDVTIDQILAVMKANSALANRIVAEVSARLPAESDCACLSAAQYAIVTDRALIADEAKVQWSYEHKKRAVNYSCCIGRLAGNRRWRANPFTAWRADGVEAS